MKKQVCGAVCFMAAEIKFSKEVRLSHLFDYVPIIVSSWHFPKVITKDQGKFHAKGQGHNTTQLFPDCNSSLNSHMMMKWCI